MRRRSDLMRRILRCRIIRIFGRRTGRQRGASSLPRANFCASKRMPQIPLICPQLGEAIAVAMVVNLLVKPGDEVHADQDVLEVETNKATMTVTSPCAGRVEKLNVALKESYPVGAVLGYLEASADEARRLGLDQPAPVPGNGSGEANGGRGEAPIRKA